MSSNTQAAATTPSVANGNNVNYIASFAKSGNDPNSFDDGIHGSYHNAYVKTTSNVGGGFNEPYRLSMSSSNFSVVDFTHSYWHIRILQEIDFTNNVRFLMAANNATIGASDTTYTDNGLTWDTLRKALDDHTTATGAAETNMVFDYTQSSSTTNTCRDAIQMKGKTGTADAGTEFGGNGTAHTYKVNSALAKAQYVFVGWKGSNQFIDDYVFLFNNMPAGESRQIFALTEGYVYNNMKSKAETCNKRNVDTTYKEAHEFNNSVCGSFISLYDIITGAIYNGNGVRIGDVFNPPTGYTGTAGVVRVPFDIIIPFDNLLSTQGFQIYPNKLFGDFGIQFRFTSAGMVHTQVKPQASMEKLIANKQLPSNLAGLSSTLYTQDSSLNYTHAFEQIGNYSKYQFFLAYDDGTDNSWTTNNGAGTGGAAGDGKGIKYSRSPIAHTGTILMQPKLGTPIVVSAFSDIRGWTLTNEALLTLQDVFMKEPFVVPAQSVDYRSFETMPSSSGFGTTACPLPLVQCESICILHPRHENDRTVFRQIQSNGYQISVNGVKFPWQIVDTLEPEFYQHQLDNSDFDGMFPARDDWENSITTPITSNGVRLSGRQFTAATANDAQTVKFTTTDVECINEPDTDNTDFMPTITLQRPTAGASLAFEGITNRYATVMITGQPSQSSAESLNNTARTTDKNPYFCNVAYDIYGNIKANGTESASTGILKYGQATPKCVPVRQCCMLFSILPERGNAKNFQFLKNDPFYIGYLDRSRDAVSY